MRRDRGASLAPWLLQDAVVEAAGPIIASPRRPPLNFISQEGKARTLLAATSSYLVWVVTERLR
jgi:hypothetical protein